MLEEKLIEAVKEYSCLYDKSSKAYRNKLKKEKAWLDVSAAIGVDVQQCQTRWRSLRDRFLKELQKKPKSGSAALEESEWKFFPALEFLKVYVAPRRTFSNSLWGVDSTDPSAFTFNDEYETDLADRPGGSNRLEVPLERLGDDLAATDNLLQSTPDTSQASFDTPSTSSGRKKNIVDQATDRFNTLLGAATGFLAQKASMGRNNDYYKVMDSFLVKLPEDVQDNLKSSFLMQIFDEIEKNK